MFQHRTQDPPTQQLHLSECTDQHGHYWILLEFYVSAVTAYFTQFVEVVYIFTNCTNTTDRLLHKKFNHTLISTLHFNLLWNGLKSISNCPHITKFVLPTRHYKLNHHNIHLSFCNQYCDATFNSDFKQS